MQIEGAAHCDAVMLQVAEHACELAQTSFGNYVIQSCLALCSDEDRCAPLTHASDPFHCWGPRLPKEVDEYMDSML